MDVHGPVGSKARPFNPLTVWLLFPVAMAGPGMLIIVKPGYICIPA